MEGSTFVLRTVSLLHFLFYLSARGSYRADNADIIFFSLLALLSISRFRFIRRHLYISLPLIILSCYPGGRFLIRVLSEGFGGVNVLLVLVMLSITFFIKFSLPLALWIEYRIEVKRVRSQHSTLMANSSAPRGAKEPIKPNF